MNRRSFLAFLSAVPGLALVLPKTLKAEKKIRANYECNFCDAEVGYKTFLQVGRTSHLQVSVCDGCFSMLSGDPNVYSSRRSMPQQYQQNDRYNRWYESLPDRHKEFAKDCMLGLKYAKRLYA